VDNLRAFQNKTASGS